MNSRMFFINVAIVVAFMAVAAGIEAFLPLFSRGEWSRGRARANLSFTALNFGFSWVLASVTAILALSLRPAGLLSAIRIPFALQIVITIVVLDFMYGYASHVLLHKIPLMWRVHQVHHNDPFVDVTTNFRTHPIETLWRFLFMTIPVWALGLPASAIVIYRFMGTLNGVLEHANIRLWQPLDKFGCWIWVTPNMHKVHHSNEHLETDSNYGNILSIYDRVFRTFTNTERAHHVIYGLKQTDPADARSFVGLLSQPFAAERRKGTLSRSRQKPRTPSRWITRTDVKVDRVACPWLIRRFIDPDAEFFFVPEDQLLERASKLGATPFDANNFPEIKLNHRGERCTFEAILEDYAIEEPTLQRLALIVRGADIRGQERVASESLGLRAIAHGFAQTGISDHERLKQQFPLYDALYEYLLKHKS